MDEALYGNIDLTPDLTGSFMGEEYEGSDIGALAETMNSGIALWKRHQLDKYEADVAKYKDTSFTKQNYLAEFNALDDEWMKDKLAQSPISDWETFEKRKRYLTHYKEQQKQVNDAYSPAQMLALGLPFAVADIDSLLISPTINAMNKARQALSLTSRMSRITSHVVSGALVGAESMAVYELTTGVQEEDSITNSALVGMALGGTLGAFMERAEIADFNKPGLDPITNLPKQKANVVDKLSSELEEFNAMTLSLEDIKKSAPYKELNPFLKKIVISPIEKLLTSDNKAVQGLATMLHAGTAHRGVVNLHNASNIRKRYNAELNTMQRSVMERHRDSVTDGSTILKFEEFEEAIALEANRVVARMQRQARSGLDGGLAGVERDTAIATRFDNLSRNYSSSELTHINKAVDDVLDYYESIHKQGNTLGMGSFQKSLKRGYLPRHYDRKKIMKIGREVAIKKLVGAQASYASQTNKIIDIEDFTRKATTAIDSSLDQTAKLKAVTQPYGKLHEKTSTSRLSQRSIEAFEDDLVDVLEMDILGSSSLYGLNVHGRLALKEKLGVESLEQVEDIFNKVDATPKEKDNFRVIIDSILGHREMTKNPFNTSQRAYKAVSSYSSLMHTMGFGVPTITEIASVAKEFGWGKTLKALVPSIKSMHTLYRNGSSKDINTIGLVGEFGTALLGHRVNRLDTGDSIANMSRLEEFIDDTTRKTSIWGGLMPITDGLKLMTLSLGVDNLARLSVAKKISPTDIMRLEDMGFSKADLPLIKKTLKVDSSGKITNMNMKSWGKLHGKMTDGLITLVDRTILHPDGITLPKFMTDVNDGAFLSKVVLKFMKFPVESYERMLLRGMQEADIKQAMGVMGNIAMWSMILTAKDATKEDKYKQYDLDTNEGMTKLMKDSLLMNSWTTGVTALGDRLSSTLTGENLFTDYNPIIGGAPVGDMRKLLWKHDPTFNTYGHNIHIGTAVSDFMNTVGILDEATKE